MTDIISQFSEQCGEHEALQPLPASEIEAVARRIAKPYDAIIGLRRCRCGGTWCWLADSGGFVHLEHIPEQL